MKNCISVLAAALVFACLPAAAQRSVQAKPQLEAEAAGISSYRLSNGFKIILIPFPSASNTRVELLVKSGSKFEGYGETGMAHLLEHMLFKGAGNRKNIKDDLTKLGASYNGTTTADRTNYFETVDPDPKKIDELIRLEADRFIRAKFTAKDLATEMTVVRNELENSEREPAQLVMSALARNTFNWHGYARSTIGARSDIEATTFQSLQNFHRKHYRPDNAALIISGSFDQGRVLALASELFSVAKNPPIDKPANHTVDTPQSATNKSELYLSKATTVVASAWKLPSLKQRDVHALDLAATAICDPDWGSLRKELVLEKKLALSASCSASAEADYSRLVAFARAGQSANAQEIATALNKHIEDAAARGVTPAQLERARLSELNAFERALDSHEVIANVVSNFEVAGDWRLFLWTRDVVKSVTLDEANQALKKWVVSTNRAEVLLRHSDASPPLEFPKPTDGKALVEGQTWPSIFSSADAPPKSLLELSKSTQRFELDGKRAQAALITRKTQGDKVWLMMENDYGTPASLAHRKTACDAASALMRFGGNGLDRDALASQMEKLQATWSLNLSGISLEVPRQNLDEAFTTLFAVWTKPDLPVFEFERYKSAQIASYEAAMRNPLRVADNEVRLRFDNFPHGHWSKPRSFEALIEETKKLSYPDVQRCSNDFANIARTRMGVVGNVDVDTVKALWAKTGAAASVTASFERLPSPRAPMAVDVTPIKVAMSDTSNAKVTGTTVLAINRKSKDFPALQLAINAMGGNSSSLIWQQLRETEGLAYSAGMYIATSSFDDRSTVQLSATSSSGNAEKALASLQAVLAKVLAEGFSPQQIKQAKDAWKEKRKTFLGVERGFASTLADSLYDGYDFAEMALFDEQIAAVDHAQASLVMRQYIKPSSILWSTGTGLAGR
ncbi:MAG: M16 family metallopeptidase [Burkholderiaceae bacterium]